MEKIENSLNLNSKFKTTEAMAIDTLAKASDKKIYNLAAGDPNLDIQECIKKAYLNVDLNKTHQYCGSQGLLKLREKIYPGHPEEVIISNGSKQLIYMSLRAVTEPGDEVVLIGPCWPSYMEICNILGVKYKLVVGEDPMYYYAPSARQIYNAITENTKAILINNPNNPTGVVYNPGFLEWLLNVALSKKIWVISDEVYSDLIYEDEDIEEFATLEGVPIAITINGFSKSCSLTGWRLGYAVACESVINVLTAIQSQMSGPPNTLIQEIIADCYDDLEINLKVFRDRVNMLAFDKNFSMHKPFGGFYFYMPIPDKWKDSKEFCDYMRDTHSIFMTPGDGYGAPRTVRISIANIKIPDLNSILDILFENFKN